jgi:hypothetical protein
LSNFAKGIQLFGEMSKEFDMDINNSAALLLHDDVEGD